MSFLGEIKRLEHLTKGLALPFFLLAQALVLSPALSQPSVEQSETPAMTLADMGPGVNPWNGRIRFPEGTDDVNVLIRCEAAITIVGALERLSCSTEEPDHRPYTSALERAARAARASPAVVDNSRRRVITVFSVLFLRQEERETIVLFQNDMSSRTEHGVGYVAPQIYYLPPASCTCPTNQRYFRRYVVDEDGTARVELPPELERCQTCLNNRTERMLFIPGQVDGRNVQTTMNLLSE